LYTHVNQVPFRRQWEPSSVPNQPYNCGPTSVAFIADFYRDATFGIEETRDLGAVHNGDGTSGPEQSIMLARRGVPNTVQAQSVAAVKQWIASGRRPVLLGLRMSVVPAAVRGHSFTGIHAVAARENAMVAGQSGVFIMDPNFGYGQTVDVQNGARFYPDSVLAAAMTGLTAVVPNAEKVVTDMTTIVDATKFIGSDGKPAPAIIHFEAGVKVYGYALDGTIEYFTAGAGGSQAPADAMCFITQTPDRSPLGQTVRITAGVFADHPYVGWPQPGLTMTAPPPPTGGGITPEEAKKLADAAAKKSAHDAALDVANQAGVPIVSKFAEEKYPA